jgi:hypothetical protein
MRPGPVIILSLCVLILASCGGGEDRAGDPPSTAKPQLCPKDSGAFDATELVGLDLKAASEEARAHRCEVRVVKEDGEKPPLISDLRTDRINVVVRDGEIVRIGGIF